MVMTDIFVDYMGVRRPSKVFVGVDPGKLTGMFAYLPDDNHVHAWELEYDDFIDTYHQIVRASHFLPTTVYTAVERFLITSRTAKLSQQTDALELIGAVNALARIWEAEPPASYIKGNIVGLMSDAWLKDKRVWAAGKGHARDAARQCFYHVSQVDPQLFGSVHTHGL